MIESLRDPLWQFIGALIGLAALVLTIVIFWFQRKRRELSYRIDYQEPLLQIDNAIAGRLKVLFDDTPVNEVYLLVVRVSNSGNVPILATDFVSPMELTLDPAAKILSASVGTQNPRNLGASISVENALQRIVVSPILMNPGDFFRLNILLTQSSYRLAVDGRVVGVREIQAKPYQAKALNTIAMVSSLMALVTVVWSFAGNYAGLLWAAAVFLVLALLSLGSAWLWRRRPHTPHQPLV